MPSLTEYVARVVWNAKKSGREVLQIHVQKRGSDHQGVVEMVRNYEDGDCAYYVAHTARNGVIYQVFRTESCATSAYNFAGRVSRIQKSSPPPYPFPDKWSDIAPSDGTHKEDHY